MNTIHLLTLTIIIVMLSVQGKQKTLMLQNLVFMDGVGQQSLGFLDYR